MLDACPQARRTPIASLHLNPALPIRLMPRPTHDIPPRPPNCRRATYAEPRCHPVRGNRIAFDYYNASPPAPGLVTGELVHWLQINQHVRRRHDAPAA